MSSRPTSHLVRDHRRLKVLCTKSVKLMQLFRRFWSQIWTMTVLQPLVAAAKHKRTKASVVGGTTKYLPSKTDTSETPNINKKNKKPPNIIRVLKALKYLRMYLIMHCIQARPSPTQLSWWTSLTVSIMNSLSQRLNRLSYSSQTHTRIWKALLRGTMRFMILCIVV